MSEVQEVQKFQSENQVSITGVLESLVINQTKNDGQPMATKDGIPFKTARAKIKVAEGETHQVEFMAMKYFKSKPEEVTTQWKAFDTYEKDYITLEDVENKSGEHFGENPTVVTARAGLEKNVYKNQAGVLQETNRLRGFFMNRETEKKEDEYGAFFTITAAVVADPKPEVKKEEETGRLLVDVGVIDYQNKLQPFTFVVEDIVDENGDSSDSVSFIEQNVERGHTMTFNGRIINRYLVQEIVRPGEGFGKKTVDVKRDRVNEILVEGGLAPESYEDYDDAEDSLDRKKVVFPDQFQEAKANWDKFIAEIEATQTKKKSAPAQAKKKSSGFGKQAQQKPVPSGGISNDDLPF